MSLPLKSIPWFSEHSHSSPCKVQPPLGCFFFFLSVPSTRVKIHVGLTMVNSVPDPEPSIEGNQHGRTKLMNRLSSCHENDVSGCLLCGTCGNNMSGFLFGALVLSALGKMEWGKAGKQTGVGGGSGKWGSSGGRCR